MLHPLVHGRCAKYSEVGRREGRAGPSGRQGVAHPDPDVGEIAEYTIEAQLDQKGGAIGTTPSHADSKMPVRLEGIEPLALRSALPVARASLTR